MTKKQAYSLVFAGPGIRKPRLAGVKKSGGVEEQMAFFRRPIGYNTAMLPL